jgi:hypothetical protein
MARGAARFKLYRVFTLVVRLYGRAGPFARHGTREADMVGLASAIFIALFGWGSTYFGWQDPEGKVQLALATTFILGAVCGFKSKG